MPAVGVGPGVGLARFGFSKWRGFNRGLGPLSCSHHTVSDVADSNFNRETQFRRNHRQRTRNFLAVLVFGERSNGERDTVAIESRHDGDIELLRIDSDTDLLCVSNDHRRGDYFRAPFTCQPNKSDGNRTLFRLRVQGGRNQEECRQYRGFGFHGENVLSAQRQRRATTAAAALRAAFGIRVEILPAEVGAEARGMTAVVVGFGAWLGFFSRTDVGFICRCGGLFLVEELLPDRFRFPFQSLAKMLFHLKRPIDGGHTGTAPTLRKYNQAFRAFAGISFAYFECLEDDSSDQSY